MFQNKKLYWYLGLALVIIVVLVLVFRGRNNAQNILTDTVKRQNLQRTVLATGEVTSETNVNLSFKSSGIVRKINVKVGQQVKEGDVLANLDQKDQLASLTQAKGSLAQARANYNKVIAGADTPAVLVAKSALQSAQTALTNAQSAYEATVKLQDTNVKNALHNLYNGNLTAELVKYQADRAEITIGGAYQGNDSGAYYFQLNLGSSLELKYWGLETGSIKLKRGVPAVLGTKGLFITVGATGDVPYGSIYTINIPNTKGTNYLANKTSYDTAVQTRDQAVLSAQNAIDSARSALQQAQASFDQVVSAARPEDVEVARAQVLAAQGQVEGAEAMVESTLIRAPADGTITAIEVKVGEPASPTTTAIVLQDIQNLYVEANVSEANIAGLAVGQDVEYTFDAIDSGVKFKGNINRIDPASTVVAGVVNFKITASVEKVEVIKPGMTANLKIVDQSRENVLTIPNRAIVLKEGGQYVRLITNAKKKTFEEVPVGLGVIGDGGLQEIVSGLNEGDEIVTDLKQ